MLPLKSPARRSTDIKRPDEIEGANPLMAERFDAFLIRRRVDSPASSPLLREAGGVTLNGLADFANDHVAGQGDDGRQA